MEYEEVISLPIRNPEEFEKVMCYIHAAILSKLDVKITTYDCETTITSWPSRDFQAHARKNIK